MFLSKKIDELIAALSHLSVEVAHLRAEVDTLKFREAVRGPENAAAGMDPAAELLNKKFAEGLDELLSFDGRVRDRGGDSDGE